MNNPQKLQDAFEDAYFAILIDAFAESEGARLLAENKRLATEPLELPEGMDERIIQAIRREYQKLRWKKIARVGRRVVSRVAVVVLAVVVLFTTLCISSSAFRERVLNIVQAWSQEYTRFHFEETSDVRTEAVPHEPYWLPDGYKKISNTDDQAVLKYETQQGNRLIIYIKDASYATNVDTENAISVENIAVNEYSGFVVNKDGTLQLIWSDTEHDKFISIFAICLSKDEVISIAQSMYN